MYFIQPNTLLLCIFNLFWGGLQQLLIFLVPTIQNNYLNVVSNTHLCQYPFSILWPEFLDIAASKTIRFKIIRSQFPPNLSRYTSVVVSGFCCGSRQIWATSKRIQPKIMWSQFPPNLSWYSSVVALVFLLWFPPNLSCLQNNPLENNVDQFPSNLSCLQNNPPENNVGDLDFIFWKMKIKSYVFWQVSSLMKLWPEKLQQGKKILC